MRHSGTDPRSPGASVATRRGWMLMAGAAVCASALVICGLWGWTRLDPRAAASLEQLLAPSADPAPPLTGAEAERLARRITIVFADAQAFWRREAPAEAEVRLFTRATASPCAGAAGATGPFYCAIDRIAGFDLAFFAALERRLRERNDLGTALIIGQTAAAQAASTAGQTGGWATGPDRRPTCGARCAPIASPASGPPGRPQSSVPRRRISTRASSRPPARS